MEPVVPSVPDIMRNDGMSVLCELHQSLAFTTMKLYFPVLHPDVGNLPTEFPLKEDRKTNEYVVLPGLNVGGSNALVGRSDVIELCKQVENTSSISLKW